MIKRNVIILLSIFIIATTACSNENDDLSFGSIMLGKEFPDSLAQAGFKYYDSEMPSYEGKITFNLPSSNNVTINVVARVDPDTKKVCLISLSGFEMSQLKEFYKMLRAKYGDPGTPYCETKSSFSSILYDSRRNIDKTPEYIQERMDWAIWCPNKNHSTIKISEFYYYESKSDEPLIYVTYINNEIYKIAVEKAIKIKKAEDEKKEIDKRERYKKTHPFMNQDF